MGDCEEIYPRLSTVYGPVESWRLGRSLGVDLLFVNSICSFRCVYCQLGKINVHTDKRSEFVPTRQVIADLHKSDWRSADVVTFSGSGEPTLAKNLGEAIRAARAITGKEVVVLTNAAHLNDEEVVADLSLADRVFCKLDASDETSFRRINRPVEGITLESVVEGIKNFRKTYDGFLAIQSMYRPYSETQFESLCEILRDIGPDEVQINTPTRAIPRAWFIEARGNYEETPYPAVTPRKVSPEDVASMVERLAERTALNVVSR
ncbi:MAG: radical SAM protein [Acidobacteriota bacterium]|nr:MAG: radical SAM protein [Acidobacteriota bacterium]